LIVSASLFRFFNVAQHISRGPTPAFANRNFMAWRRLRFSACVAALCRREMR
jgi:hypothetical protein